MRRLLMLVFSCFVGSCIAGTSPWHMGFSHLTLQHIVARNITGEPAPQYNQQCINSYKSWLGKQLTAQYKVNTVSLQQIAFVQGQDDSYILHPEGLSGNYSFMQSMPELPSHLTRVIYSVSKQFDDPHASLLFASAKSLAAGYQCVVSD